MKEKGKYDDKVRRQRRRNRVVKVCMEQISLGMSKLSGSVAYLCIYIYQVLCEQVQSPMARKPYGVSHSKMNIFDFSCEIEISPNILSFSPLAQSVC